MAAETGISKVLSQIDFSLHFLSFDTLFLRPICPNYKDITNKIKHLYFNILRKKVQSHLKINPKNKLKNYIKFVMLLFLLCFVYYF